MCVFAFHPDTHTNASELSLLITDCSWC